MLKRGLNPLPDNRILDWSKLKQIADDISAIKGRKHCEKKSNCLLQVISPFLTIFSTAIYLYCIKMRNCVVMG